MLVLFDIDGTLLLSNGLGVRCMQASAERLFQRTIDLSQASFPGSLDPIIFRDLCRTNGIEYHARYHERFREDYTARVRRELAEGLPAYTLPGVDELIAALAGKDGLMLGLLTGNYAETGLMKVISAGLDPDLFRVAAWGTDGDERAALVPVALERYRARTGRQLAFEEVLLIGDTPLDVHCARANGCPVLGVATGRHSVTDLEEAGAHRAVADLGDTAAVLEWILATIG